MRATLCLLCGLAFLLGGCRRSADSLADLAENTRSSTERMVVDTEQANAQRERRGAADVGDMHNPPPVKLVERYETRQGPDGLFVYDTETHSTARLGRQAQSGLTPQEAETSVDALMALDAKGAAH